MNGHVDPLVAIANFNKDLEDATKPSEPSTTPSSRDQFKQQVPKPSLYANFHGDESLGDQQDAVTGKVLDVSKAFTLRNAPKVGSIIWKAATGKGLDVRTR